MTEGQKITADQLRVLFDNLNLWNWSKETLGEDWYLRGLAACINKQFEDNAIDDFERSH